MAKLETVCNECVFYNDENKCKLGKIDKFISAGANVVCNSDGHRIDRVCMFNRPYEWAAFMTIYECEDQVNEEVYVGGTILILVEDIHDLEKCLDTLHEVPNIDRFKIIINHSEKIPKDLMENFTKNLDFDDYMCMITFIEDIDRRVYEGFLKSKNGVFIVIDASKDFECNFIDKIDNMINGEMIRVGHIKPVEGHHLSVTPSLMYKYLHGCAEKPIAEKLIELGYENTVFEWKDVDEKYPD